MGLIRISNMIAAGRLLLQCRSDLPVAMPKLLRRYRLMKVGGWTFLSANDGGLESPLSRHHHNGLIFQKAKVTPIINNFS